MMQKAHTAPRATYRNVQRRSGTTRVVFSPPSGAWSASVRATPIRLPLCLSAWACSCTASNLLHHLPHLLPLLLLEKGHHLVDGRVPRDVGLGLLVEEVSVPGLLVDL